MSNRKQELVELIMGIVTPGNADRKTLDLHNVPELEAIYESAYQEEQLLQDRAKAAAQTEMARIAKQQLDELRKPEQDRQQRAQDQADRRTFEAAARELKFKICDANFHVIREVLGPGFTIQNIKDQPLRLLEGQELIPATAQELTQWRQEEIQARNQYLKTADPQTLRTEAKQEAVQNREYAANTQFERDLIVGLTRDAHLPLLPEYYWTNGKRIDPDFIRRADRQTLAILIKRFGGSRVTARLHQISSIGSFTLN